MQTYTEYKDSGVDWLGKIPVGWEEKPVFAVTAVKSVTGCADRELLSVYLDRGVIRFSDIDEKRTNVTSLDLSNYQEVDNGDFVLNNQQAWRGSVGVSSYAGIVSPAYIVLRLSDAFFTAFANYFFRDRDMVAHYLVCSKGVGTIQRNLYWPKLKRTPLFLPPLPEQTAIANFLDDKTAKIDELVGIKRRQIAFLGERKQILIQNAVTKGLNPDAPLKASGVDWIGKIPAHWEVKRSKYVFTQRKELAKPNDIQLSATQAYGVIPQEEYEKRVGRKVVKILFNLEKRKHVEIDDFVISMRSFQGGLERARASGCIRSSYVILQPNLGVVPLFFGYVLKSPRYIRAIQSTASFIRDGQDLNFENFSKVDLFIPPRQEQQEIAGYIEVNAKKIDVAITIKQNQITKLNEYKTTLINAAVTGKIKVV